MQNLQVMDVPAVLLASGKVAVNGSTLADDTPGAVRPWRRVRPGPMAARIASSQAARRGPCLKER